MPWDYACPKCCSMLTGGSLGDETSDKKIAEDIRRVCGGKIFLCKYCKGTKFSDTGEVFNYTESYIDYDTDEIITKEQAEASGKEIVLGG